MKFFIVSTLLLAATCSASLYGAVSTQYLSQDSLGQYSYGYAEPNSQKHETRTADGVTHGAYSYVDGHGIVQSVKYSSDPVHGFQVAATNLPVGPAAPAHHVVPVHYAPAPVSYIAHATPISYAAHYAAPLHYSHGHAAHALPQPVQDTPEVAAAKIAHFAAHAEAKANLHHHHKRSTWGYTPSSWSHAAAPQIHNGVPVETPEVQQAKAAHFAAHAAAAHGSAHYAPDHYSPAKYAAPAHYAAPVIHNGVPVDTPEVQHAKAAHFAAVAEAQARSTHYSHEPAHYAPAHYNHVPAHYAAPVIHNGVPVETPEVQHAKAAHFAAVAEAKSRSGNGHDYDRSWDEGHNSWDNGHNSWDNGHHDW